MPLGNGLGSCWNGSLCIVDLIDDLNCGRYHMGLFLGLVV